MANTILDTNSYLRKHTPDQINEELDILNLEISEDDLVKSIDQRLDAADKFYNSQDIKLKKRRKKNKDYLFGKQNDLSKLKRYQTEYMDNLIYEAESTIKPIALSRLPDMLVKPGKDTEQSKELAKNLTKLINNDIRKRDNRRVLGTAWKHLPVYFVGCIKAFWDPSDGKYGDYKFKVVHPERVVIDHTASSPDNAEWVVESVDLSIQETIMRWPKKEKEIREACGITGQNENEKLSSIITLSEVWFKWWDKEKDKEDVENRDKTNMPNLNGWKEVNAVCWKYKNLILGKMKNPYWDWEGETQLNESDSGRKVQLDKVVSAVLGLLPTEVAEVFNNYFQRPQFPYIFMTYDQWGEYPIDYTSRLEQSLSLQENHNKRGMQITDMNDRSRGKHVFSTKSGYTKKEIERMDMDNPWQDLIVNGPVNEGHNYIQSPPASAPLFQELDNDKERLFAKMGTHSTTRGERQGQDTATGLQMYRESDFGRIDDEVEETINAVAEKMSQWNLQFIKLFYTEEHMVSFLGPDGSVSFQAFTRDAIDDGMEVVVSASGVDKMMAKREAYERARMQLTDPLTFFTDVGASNPRERAEKLMMFNAAPELYLKQYVQNQSPEDMANQLKGQPIPPPQQAPLPTPVPGAVPIQPSQGMTPPPPPSLQTGSVI